MKSKSGVHMTLALGDKNNKEDLNMRDEVKEEVADMREPEYNPIDGKLKNCTRLNVRQLPNPTSAVNGVINAKDRIVMDGTYKNPKWVKIVNPVFGYVNKDYIEVK